MAEAQKPMSTQDRWNLFMLETMYPKGCAVPLFLSPAIFEAVSKDERFAHVEIAKIGLLSET